MNVNTLSKFYIARLTIIQTISEKNISNGLHQNLSHSFQMLDEMKVFEVVQLHVSSNKR